MRHILNGGHLKGSVINEELLHVVNDHIESYSINQ